MIEWDTGAALKFAMDWKPGREITLTAIHPDNGKIDTRTFSPTDPVSAHAWIEGYQGQRNIYFTVNQVSQALNRKPRKGDIDALLSYHVDLDPVAEKDPEEQQAEIHVRLRTFPVPPTAIIFSGGGYQGFWKLKAPLTFETPESAEQVNKAISKYLGGDHCHNIDRIMRLPGTINLPNKKKRAAGRVAAASRVVDLDWSRTYLPDEFSFLLSSVNDRSGSAKSEEKNSSHVATFDVDILPVSRRIRDLIQGKSDPNHPYPSRSEAVFAVLIAMTSSGCSDDQIRQVFLDVRHPIAAHVLDQKKPEEYLHRQIKKARSKHSDSHVEEINRQHALILIGDKAVILKESTSPEGRPTFNIIGIGAFNHWYANRFVPQKNSEKMISLARYWLSHPQRRQYEGIVFAPGREVAGALNLWRGFAVKPASGDCTLFLKHLLDNVCNGDAALYTWVIAWFADIAQRPDRKSGTSLVIRGREGTGKTKVGEVFGSLFGEHYLAVSDPRYVTGRFNSHMTSCLLMHCEEAFWAGDHAGESKLKDLITGSHHLIEYKGKEPIRVQNFIRLLVTGNPDWVVPVSLEGRRFAVLEISDVRMRDTAYFAAIDKQMNEGGREALLQYLLNFDLSNVDLRTVPKTAALLEQKVASLTPEQGWWLDVLSSGRLPEGCELHNECPTIGLFEHYIAHANKSGARRRSIETKLGTFLKKAVPGIQKRLSAYRIQGGNNTQGSVYEFPDLATCRRDFSRMVEQEIPWDGPDEWIQTAAPSTDPDGQPM